MASPHSPSVGYFELVRRNANYRNLWLGQIVSLLGDWFNLIASASMVAQLTNSGLAVSGLFVVRMIAPFLISPIAGVAADRYNRKHLLIGADLVRGVVVLGFLLVREPQHVWLLYTLTAVQLGLSGFFFPARNAILPDIVSPAEIGAANALSSATWSTMLAFGAALGGLVAGQFGVYPAYIIDALTFLVSAYFIWRVRYVFVPETLNSEGSGILAGIRQYVDGLRYLFRNVDILLVALHKSAGSFFVSGAFQVIQVPIASTVFVIGEGGGTSLGLMYAFVGIGTGLGPILARAISGDDVRRQRIAIIFGYIVAAVGLAITSTMHSFGVVLLGTLLRGVGVAIAWVFATQLLLVLVPNRVRGRVFSSEFAMQTLMNAASSMIGGAALEQQVEFPTILGIMAVSVLLPAVLWALWVFRGKRWHMEPLVDPAAS